MLGVVSYEVVMELLMQYVTLISTAGKSQFVWLKRLTSLKIHASLDGKKEVENCIFPSSSFSIWDIRSKVWASLQVILLFALWTAGHPENQMSPRAEGSVWISVHKCIWLWVQRWRIYIYHQHPGEGSILSTSNIVLHWLQNQCWNIFKKNIYKCLHII